MTNEEQKELIQKESKRLWKRRGFKWLALGVVILLVIAIVHSILFHTRLILCSIRLYVLDPALVVYMNDYDGKLPLPDSWNDLLIEYSEVNNSIFHCPGSKSSGNMSDYAINVNVYGKEKFSLGDTVSLFERKPGWNQVGGPEIFNSSNHSNKGGNYNTWRIPEGQFVESAKVESLKWKPEKVPEAQR